MSSELSGLQARRIALAAQGFGARPAKLLNSASICRLIRKVGAIQIDSVNALVRSHYLPLYSRLGHYPQAWLDELAWKIGRKRKLFEYWGHEASLLPVELHPFMRWRMARARDGRGIYPKLAAFGRERRETIQRVVATVRERGAVSAGELSSREKPAGAWWDWSEEKHALEWLFAAGEIAVAGRRGFERVYDLTERVLPDAVLRQETPTEGEAHRGLMLQAAGALGVATERDLRDYFRLSPLDSKKAIASLLGDGLLEACAVDGWKSASYMLPGTSAKRRIDACALLSPFDSLVWDRQRTERLFGFRYRLEIYTPADRRQYGYYVLPFLYGERIAARLDLRADRARGALSVLAVHEEDGGLNDDGRNALALQLVELARWLQLHRIQCECTRIEGGRLRILLQSHAAN